MATVSALHRQIDYPTSDGKPMAETNEHRKVAVDLIDVLQHRYRDRSDVYVSGDLLLFYEPGNRNRHVAPDVFVCFDVENRLRPNYLVWEEGKAPDFIIEVTSKSTRDVDQTTKSVLYRDVLGVREYFQFDPFEEYLSPSLQGQRLVDGEYVPIAWENGGLPSDVLGVRLVREGWILRLIDIATGERLLTSAERAELEAERAELESERAELEAERAERESERADREVEARKAAEKAKHREAARAEREAARAEREAEARKAAEEDKHREAARAELEAARAERESEARRAAEELARRLQAERDQMLAELERLKRG